MHTIWLLNLQIAFFLLLLVTLASFYLIKNIQNRLENLDKIIFQVVKRDKIDEIDDPFDLYSEYKEVPEK